MGIDKIPKSNKRVVVIQITARVKFCILFEKNENKFLAGVLHGWMVLEFYEVIGKTYYPRSVANANLTGQF